MQMNIQMKKYVGRGTQERAQIFRTISGCTALPAPPCVQQPGSSWNPILLGFYGGFIT